MLYSPTDTGKALIEAILNFNQFCMLCQAQYGCIWAWKITDKYSWAYPQGIIGKTLRIIAKVDFGIEFTIYLNDSIGAK
jgi:hypothetical protein